MPLPKPKAKFLTDNKLRYIIAHLSDSQDDLDLSENDDKEST